MKITNEWNEEMLFKSKIKTQQVKTLEWVKSKSHVGMYTGVINKLAVALVVVDLPVNFRYGDPIDLNKQRWIRSMQGIFRMDHKNDKRLWGTHKSLELAKIAAQKYFEEIVNEYLEVVAK